MPPKPLQKCLLLPRLLDRFTPLSQSFLVSPQGCPLSLPFTWLVDNPPSVWSWPLPYLLLPSPGRLFCALPNLQHAIVFVYIYLLILSLHPVPHPVYPPPHILSEAGLQGPWGKGDISFVIMTLVFSAIPNVKQMLKQGLLNEWISKGHLMWQMICHSFRTFFIIFMLPFTWYRVTWLLFYEKCKYEKRNQLYL